MTPIRLVIGLANPGEKYALTRHNAGEWFVTLFAPANMRKRERALHADIAKGECLFAVPTTYMNLSGQAAQGLSHYYKIKPEEILVAHDDIDLPTGAVRLKQGGGHGGHNGLRDIIRCLNSNDFWRLRIGVARPTHSGQVENYVISPPSKEERNIIDTGLSKAQDILPHLLKGEFQKAMHLLHTSTL